MSTVPFVQSGVQLAGYEFGSGLPVIFQHGLGGDASQVAEIFPDGPTIRRLTLECRSLEIDGAIFAEITSKMESKARYVEDFRSTLKAFLDDCVMGNFQRGMAPDRTSIEYPCGSTDHSQL